MPDQLRQRITDYLSNGSLGVLSTHAPTGVISLPVRYRSDGLELECLVPRWSDIAHLLEQNPNAAFAIMTDTPESLSWLHYSGRAAPVAAPRWDGLMRTTPTTIPPADLFIVLRLRPTRIELVHSWWVRETLDFE